MTSSSPLTLPPNIKKLSYKNDNGTTLTYFAAMDDDVSCSSAATSKPKTAAESQNPAAHGIQQQNSLEEESSVLPYHPLGVFAPRISRVVKLRIDNDGSVKVDIGVAFGMFVALMIGLGILVLIYPH